MNRLSCYIDRTRLKRLEQTQTSAPHNWISYRQVLESFKPFGLPHKFYLNQVWAEWEQLIKLAFEHRVRRVLEIGTGRAGSTYFWSKLTSQMGGESLIVTVDENDIASDFVSLFDRSFASQKIISIVGNSHDSEVVARVAQSVPPQSIDLLYIDGDHSYEGVKRDFENYQKFCKPDGLICFHDINPDFGVTKGIETDVKSGDVYKFWRELKQHRKNREIIAEAGQNGFGIGVITNDPS